MPVKTRGKKVIEARTGKVVATGRTEASARASARIRNEAWRKKHKRKCKD